MDLRSIEDWATLLSGAGTVAAVFVAWLVHWDSRRTQRLLSRPYVSFNHRIGPTRFELEAVNVGHGPAFVSNLQVYIRGDLWVRQPNMSATQYWGQGLARVCAVQTLIGRFEKALVLSGASPIGAGQSLALILVHFEPPIQQDQIDRLGRDLEVTISYRSVFDEQWDASSRRN